MKTIKVLGYEITIKKLWRPKFKVGDTIEVTEDHWNTPYGIGSVAKVESVHKDGLYRIFEESCGGGILVSERGIKLHKGN
jgi:surface antigen